MTSDDLCRCLISLNEVYSSGEPANVVDGLFAIARALDRVAKAVSSLDVKNKDGEVEFVEYLAKHVSDSGDWIASAISEVAIEISKRKVT